MGNQKHPKNCISNSVKFPIFSQPRSWGSARRTPRCLCWVEEFSIPTDCPKMCPHGSRHSCSPPPFGLPYLAPRNFSHGNPGIWGQCRGLSMMLESSFPWHDPKDSQVFFQPVIHQGLGFVVPELGYPTVSLLVSVLLQCTRKSLDLGEKWECCSGDVGRFKQNK